MVQYQRRNIHASCGRSGADHNAKGHSDSQSGKQRTQPDIFCQNNISQHLIQHFQCCRINKRTDHRCHSKRFSKHSKPHKQHNYIKNKYKSRYWNTDVMVHRQGNSCRSSRHKPSRQQKKPHSQCIQNISKNHHQNGDASSQKTFTSFFHKISFHFYVMIFLFFDIYFRM